MLHSFGRDGALAPLQSPNFRLFFTGQAISVLGSWLQIVAEGWLVYKLTHSPAWLGLVAGAAVLPGLLLTLWGGQIADRCPRRRILIATHSACMLLALLLAVLASGWWVPIEPWHIALVAVGSSTINAFSGPAFQAFLPELVSRPAMTSAIALNSMLWNGARVLGPLLATALILRFGVASCFLLNGLSYTAMLVALARIRLNQPSTARIPRTNVWAGLGYVRHHPEAVRALVLAAVTACFGWSFHTLLPALAHERFAGAASGSGGLMTATGIGSLLGCVAMAASAEGTRRGFRLYGSAFVYAGALAAFAAAPVYSMALATVAIVGFGLIVCGVSINACLQEWVPDHLRGRVMALFSLIFVSLQPLGGFLAGLTAELIGTGSALRIAAAMCLLSAAALYLWSQEERHSAVNAPVELALEAA